MKQMTPAAVDLMSYPSSSRCVANECLNEWVVALTETDSGHEFSCQFFSASARIGIRQIHARFCDDYDGWIEDSTQTYTPGVMSA
jgi:hypothetical protein